MAKYKFEGEFEINASKKMLYNYLFTPGGLAQWFADDVTVNEDKIYNFIWDGEENKAKLVAQRTNNMVKFEFLEDQDSEEGPNYVELKLDQNEMTETVFLRVIDYSDMDDDEELQDLWTSMTNSLKELVGG